MELNTITLSDFVRNAQILFLKGIDTVQMNMRSSGLFRVEPVPQNTGNTREYSDIDLENYAKAKGEGAQSERARVQQGYSKIATLKRVALDIGITYEMRTQNKYQEVVSRLTNLGMLAARRMELDLSHRITFGQATSYVDMDGQTVDTTVGDGFQLFYNLHTVRGSATTYSNQLAGNPAFSKTALEGMELLCVEETINQFGEKMAMPYDVLYSTDDPNTVNTIRVELRSTSNTTVDTNSGVINVNQTKYRHVILPLVATDAYGLVDGTKATYWGLASTMYSSGYLGIHEEPRLKTPPANGNNAEEFSTDDWNFGTRAGYFITVVSGMWIKFSEGDGS